MRLCVYRLSDADPPTSTQEIINRRRNLLGSDVAATSIVTRYDWLRYVRYTQCTAENAIKADRNAVISSRYKSPQLKIQKNLILLPRNTKMATNSNAPETCLFQHGSAELICSMPLLVERLTLGPFIAFIRAAGRWSFLHPAAFDTMPYIGPSLLPCDHTFSS